MRHPNKHRKVVKPSAEELGHILPRSEEQKAADAKRAAEKAARQARAAARAKARKAKQRRAA